MRFLTPVLSVLALSACVSPEAGSQEGVGFQSYSDYIYQQQMAAERDAARRRDAGAAAAPAPAAAPASGSAAIAADTLAALRGPEAAAPAAQPLPPAPPVAPVAGQPLSALAPVTPVAPVAAPLPAAPAAPVAPQVAPSPAPAPAATGGSNIAAFALSTSHPVGQKMYSRNNPFRQSAFDRACAQYPSDANAQEAFLEAGGPARDRLNLDPDGDGYACRWDPAPFRLARQGG